jgi:hypothetical protein
MDVPLGGAGGGAASGEGRRLIPWYMAGGRDFGGGGAGGAVSGLGEAVYGDEEYFMLE